MPKNMLFFEDLEVGKEWVSPSRIVTQEEVLLFADLTGDHDPLHVDAEFAATTPYRQTIAHGLLGLSFMAGLSSHHPCVRTSAFVGLRDWTFDKPIFMGDAIQTVTRVQALNNHGRKHGEVIWERKLINQDGLVVQHGVLVTLVARRSVLRADTSHAGPYQVSSKSAVSVTESH